MDAAVDVAEVGAPSVIRWRIVTSSGTSVSPHRRDNLGRGIVPDVGRRDSGDSAGNQRGSLYHRDRVQERGDRRMLAKRQLCRPPATASDSGP
ncbi:hypothetical protein C5C31_09050 [Rathayibacter rathayi]|nr:hypothetical protein C5C23_07295 [Rathayibacter rathayi]PPH22219.1 hypothetical protein C5C31_09050 [Rathayibacter rathayi]PPI76260.1 hypothetical protein C5E03_10900 [Rathayibacter rathayi]